MNEIWFIPLLGILGIASTIISSKGGLYDKRFKWYKRITGRGRIVTTLGCAIIGLSVWQSIKVNKDHKLQDEIQIKLKKSSDSTISAEIKSGVDSNRKKLFSDLSQAFAVQQLALDTVTKTVKSLRDSAKIRIIEKDDPVLEIHEVPGKNVISIIEEKNNNYQFKILLSSSDAASSFFEIKSSIVTEDSLNNLFYISFHYPLKQIKKISKDAYLGLNFTANNVRPFKLIYFWYRGKYKNIDNTKEMYMDEVYEFNPTNNQTGIATPDKQDLVKKIVLGYEK